MTIKRSIKTALAAGVCMFPLQAMAQSFDIGDQPAAPAATPATNNYIDLGAQYQSGRADYLNRYRGREAATGGFGALGGFQYRSRDAWDSGGTHYLEILGSDLGFQDRSLSAKFGQQGTWALGFSYDGVPYEAASDFKSIFQTDGSLVAGVKPGSLDYLATAPKVQNNGRFNGVLYPGVGQNTFLPALAHPPTALLNNYDIGTQRDIFSGNGKYELGALTLSSTLRHEHKSGYYINSAVIAGSAPAAITTTAAPAATAGQAGYFAQPIDYDTDRLDLTAALANTDYQAQLSYIFSNFQDNINVINLQNPYSNPSGTGTGAGTLFAPYTLPPSNMEHKIKANFGYNFSPTMRLNTNLAYGVQLQNATFITSTGDFASQSAVNFPRNSLNGYIGNLFGNVALTAEPLPKTDVRVSYTIDDRENKTPRNAYFVQQRSDGTSDCSTASVSTARCYNAPFSYEKQSVTAEAGYRVLPQTKISLSDTYDMVWRTYTDVYRVGTNRVTAKVRSALMDEVVASVSVAHEDRNAGDYDPQAWWRQIAGPNAPNQTEARGMMMYFEESRKHDEVKGTVDVSPTNTVTTTLTSKVSKDTYPDSTYGMRSNHNLVVGPDVSWQVSPTIGAHAFYEYQQLFYDQASVYESSTSAPTVAGTGFIVPWRAKTTDSVHTMGMMVDWQAIKDVLTFSVSDDFAYGDTAYAITDGGAFGGTATSTTYASATIVPLPNTTSLLNTFSVRGEYTFHPGISAIFGYAYERYKVSDFMNGTSATQYANFLLPGTQNPNESIHVVGATMRFKF